MQKQTAGSIELILGPMFAGKSTEMLRRVERLQITKKKCVLIKYKNDVRYSSNCVSTHNGKHVIAVPCEKLCELDAHLSSSDYEVIGIDEGQFFPDLVEFCLSKVQLGKRIIISALDGTFEQKPFGNVLQLIPHSEDTIKLKAVCMECGSDAPFTIRTTNQKEQEVIGGCDTYKACCRACLTEFKQQQELNT